MAGPERQYWVAFDEPQRDVDGDDPCEMSQVSERYLVRPRAAGPSLSGTSDMPYDGAKARPRRGAPCVVLAGDRCGCLDRSPPRSPPPYAYDSLPPTLCGPHHPPTS